MTGSQRKRLRIFAAALAFLLIGGLPLGPSSAAEAESPRPPGFTEIIESQQDAVVNISTTRKIEGSGPELPERFEGTPLEPFFRRFFGGPEGQEGRKVHSLGSGFFVSSEGHIVTNAHVIKDAAEIVVQLKDRRQLEAEVLGKDMATDLAVLKVDAEDLPTVEWASGDDLRVGEWVLAMGAPFGFENSATAGIVSAKGRSIQGKVGSYVPFLQTDVAINPGSSGGPLFNLDGEVVGVNAQIYSRSGGYMGLSFAIPAQVAQDAVAQIKESGDVEHGYLGVALQDIDRDLADSLGMDKPQGGLVAQVKPNSPAAKAGIQTGDVILEVNGEPVSEAGEVPHEIGSYRPGDDISFTLLREGERLQKSVTLASLAEARGRTDTQEAEPQSALGMELAPVPEELRQRRPLPESGGALVKGLSKGPAQNAGIRPGDILLKLGGKSVSGPGDVTRILEETSSGSRIPVLVQRQDQALYLALRIP